jgi:hypothetical protein
MFESWQNLIGSSSINEAPSKLLDNALYPLSSHRFIDISGIDAGKFLQGQLSCDVQQITLKNSGIGAHCNAQGRMQSSFRICRYNNDKFLLRIHHSIQEHAQSALAKYIIFSKAAIGISSNMVGIGLHGESATNLLAQHFHQLPDNDYEQLVENEYIVICTSKTMKAYELYTSAEKALQLWVPLAQKLTTCNAYQHQLIENYLGLAFVDAGTFNEFTPQMFNYQQTPAISFKKGCYTGQEIIARLHYRGQLKRRMRHFSASSNISTTIESGFPIFIQNNTQPAGYVISAVPTNLHEWDLLINLSNDFSDNELKIGNSVLTNLTEIALPYDKILND